MRSGSSPPRCLMPAITCCLEWPVPQISTPYDVRILGTSQVHSANAGADPKNHHASSRFLGETASKSNAFTSCHRRWPIRTCGLSPKSRPLVMSGFVGMLTESEYALPRPRRRFPASCSSLGSYGCQHDPLALAPGAWELRCLGRS